MVTNTRSLTTAIADTITQLIFLVGMIRMSQMNECLTAPLMRREC